jgi:ATP-dependent helicase/nuclease subunit B
MKVYFSSNFDSGYYLDYSDAKNQALFNLKVAGPQALLGLLEQKTGNTGKFKSHAERKIEYMGYLKEYMAVHADVFYAYAFDTDQAGIASELLRYRDQLVLAGWNKIPRDVSLKVNTLLAIENQFEVSPGFEDRWVNMQDVLEKLSANPGIAELLLFDDEADLHPFYRKILQRLGTLGVKISKGFVNNEINTDNNLGKLQQWLLTKDTKNASKLTLDPTDKKSLQLFTFQTDLEAAHFFAAQELSGYDHLVICDNSLVFDSVSSTLGKARPGGGKNLANTTTLQLFKLSSSLFAQPFNILNYMAYLQCPLHPVSKALRGKIMKQLSDTGGFNPEDINEIINTHDFYPFTDEGSGKDANNKKKQKEAREILFPVNADRDELPASQILKFYHTLETWAVQKCKINTYGEKLDDSEKKQLMHVYKMAGLLGEAIRQAASEHITTDMFMQCVRDIYEPVEVTQGYAEKGSPTMISSPGQIISRPEVTVWLDFCNQEINPGWYDFLSDEELKTFEDSGLSVWRKADQAAATLSTFMKVIERTKSKLCLAIPLKTGDKRSSDHPLYSFLKSVVKNLDELITPVSFPYSLGNEYGWNHIETENIGCIALPAKKTEHQIEQGSFIPKREKESYSSTELLVQFPFDWVMQYGMHIKPGNSYEMGEVETTLGNVAHAFIQDLFESEDYRLQDIIKRLNEDYDTLIQQAVIKYGAILLLEENRFELQQLTSQLKKSLQILMKIITDNKLTIIKSEAEITCKLQRVNALSEQDFTGSLDLLLQDDQGKDVIFDLKWARRDKKYVEKLREGKAMQLALYNELLKESKLQSGQRAPDVKSGYYLLNQARLITCDDFVGDAIIRVETDHNHNEIINRISNSIVYRREQFSMGIIEEGEDEPKENMLYYNDAQEKQLIPLDLDSNNKKKKKNFYSKYKVFKGD